MSQKNDKNINIGLLPNMKQYFKIDKFQFKRDQNYISLQNIHDKVLCVKNGIIIAKNVDIIDANELFNDNFGTEVQSNNLVKISDLPISEQEIYKEFLDW